MAELLPLKKYPFEFYQFCKGLTSSVKGLPFFEAGPHSGVGSSSDSRARGPGFDTQSGHTFISPSADSRRAVVSYWQKCVHEVLVNRLGSRSLPRNSVVRLTDHLEMTIAIYCGCKTTYPFLKIINTFFLCYNIWLNYWQLLVSIVSIF